VLFQLPAHRNKPVGLHARELILSSGGEATTMSLLGLALPEDHVYTELVLKPVPLELPENIV